MRPQNLSDLTSPPSTRHSIQTLLTGSTPEEIAAQAVVLDNFRAHPNDYKHHKDNINAAANILRRQLPANGDIQMLLYYLKPFFGLINLYKTGQVIPNFENENRWLHSLTPFLSPHLYEALQLIMEIRNLKWYQSEEMGQRNLASLAYQMLSPVTTAYAGAYAVALKQLKNNQQRFTRWKAAKEKGSTTLFTIPDATYYISSVDTSSVGQKINMTQIYQIAIQYPELHSQAVFFFNGLSSFLHKELLPLLETPNTNFETTATIKPTATPIDTQKSTKRSLDTPNESDRPTKQQRTSPPFPASFFQVASETTSVDEEIKTKRPDNDRYKLRD